MRSIFLKDEPVAYQSEIKTDVNNLKVGTVSSCNTAIVGHDGWIFINEGSNNYKGAYSDRSLESLVPLWENIFSQRRSACEARGSEFLQLIVPNKASILNDKFPESLGGRENVILSGLLKSTERCFFCPLEELRLPSVRESIFRKNDSHLTIFGNALISELILKRFNIPTDDICKITTMGTEQIGDLGSKFQSPIYEKLIAPAFDSSLNISALNKTYEKIVDGFNGTIQCFENEEPVIDKSIVVFGNSFFEKVPSWGMSPIFANLFKRFYFMWTPTIDLNVISKLAPDYVIAQTCERFLTKVPEN